MNEKSKGILLSAIPYLGQKKILKIFTPTSGMLSLISRSAKWAALTTPFCAAEWVFRRSEREIFSLLDGTLLDPFLPLRSSFNRLSAAGKMAGDLLRSQLPHKPSPLLYELFSSYLKRLELTSHPEVLAMSFRLKLLIHDGLFSPTEECRASLCSEMGLLFTPEEWEAIQLSSAGRQFSQIEMASASPSVLEKIERLFLGKCS